MFGVHSGFCFLLSGARLDAIFPLWGAQLLGFAPLQPFRVYPWQAYVEPDDGHWSTPGMHRVAAPSIALSRGSLLLLSLLFPNYPIYGGAYSLGGLAEIHPIPPPSQHDGRGLLFQVWCHQMM